MLVFIDDEVKHVGIRVNGGLQVRHFLVKRIFEKMVLGGGLFLVLLKTNEIWLGEYLARRRMCS